MKRYMNNLCYTGDKIQIVNGEKVIIDKKIDLVYDEENDKFIELEKNILPGMEILNSKSCSEYNEDLCDTGFPYKESLNNLDIFIDEKSISLNPNEYEYLKRLVKDGIIKVPNCIFPNKKNWEQLGFSFSESTSQNLDYYYMTIPNKWSLEINERCGVFNIIDDNGRTRGYINPSKNNHYKEPFMILFPRYNIHRYIDDRGEYLYFGEKDRPLFISNAINDDNRILNEIIIFEKANILYPGWKNPSKYWDRRSAKKLTKNS